MYKLTLLFFIILISCNETGKGEDKQEPAVTGRADAETGKIKLAGLDGKPVELAQYKDKAIFINFWATWCKPCLQEMPSIQKAKTLLEKENIVFLFASDEPVDMIEAFRASHDFNFNYNRVESFAELNIMALPTTFIFNPTGKLVFSEMGFRQWDDPGNIQLLLKIAKDHE